MKKLQVFCVLFIGGLMNFLMADEFEEQINLFIDNPKSITLDECIIEDINHDGSSVAFNVGYKFMNPSLGEKICYARCLFYLNDIIDDLEEGYCIYIDFYRFFVEEKNTTGVVDWSKLEEQFCEKLREEGKNPETIKEGYLAYLERDPYDEEYDEDCE